MPEKLKHGTWQVFGLALFLMVVQAEQVVAKGSEDVTLTTKDGVTLAATYYASSEKEKATPVIILHDYKGSRAEYDGLARKLQTPSGNHQSLAVLTVDLRGHGGSTIQQLRGGGEVALDVSKFKKRDFENMVNFDMETVRSFLVVKNDAEDVNINKLSIIGVGLGASVGTIWAANDWSVPPLAIGKQGQDVKALVLVSPRWKNNGLLIQQALRQRGVQRMVAMMMIYGSEDRRVKADVLRIKKQVEKYHPEPESSADKPRDLVGLGVPNTRLQGGALLLEVGDRAVDRIADFLDVHVVQENHKWSQRRNRLR